MIADFNRVPVQELGSNVMDLGGAGTGFESFNQHMAAVGVSVGKAPDMGVEAEGPKNDLSNLVLGVQNKPLTPGGR